MTYEHNKKKVYLSEISEYSTNKISINEVGITNYVSTENLIPEFGGKVIASGLPSIDKVQRYGVGDVLISNIRPYFKKIWFADSQGGASNDVLVIRSKENAINEYLYYALANDDFFSFVMSGAKGTKMPRGDKNHIMTYMINLPPLQEQKAIAHILSTLDEKIETNNKINKTLEEMAQAIFKHWFVDFEFPNEDGEPYKSSGGEMVDSELGPIPKGWEVKSIYSLADFIYGAPFSSKLFNERAEGLPLIRIRDLKTGNPQFYTNEQHRNSTIVEPGDILIGMDAEFKPTVWKGKRAVLNQRVCLLRPRNSNIHRYYLYELVKPHMRSLEFSKTGTTVIHFGKSDVDSIMIVHPSFNLLKAFNNLITPIHGKLVNISIENRTLASIRDTLLPNLMSGEIRVPIDNEQ